MDICMCRTVLMGKHPKESQHDRVSHLLLRVVLGRPQANLTASPSDPWVTGLERAAGSMAALGSEVSLQFGASSQAKLKQCTQNSREQLVKHSIRPWYIPPWYEDCPPLRAMSSTSRGRLAKAPGSRSSNRSTRLFFVCRSFNSCREQITDSFPLF